MTDRVVVVVLTSPASAADISEAKSTSDCPPATGIGDFACLQWTGYLRSEADGRSEDNTSASVILTAVRGNEILEMHYMVPPPMAGSGVPDGDAMARALSQAAVEAGWGNGAALGVPSAPPVGPPAATNNAVCAQISRDEVRQAFGISPDDASCSYTFGGVGTPGPDSLVFSIEVLRGEAPALTGGRVPGELLDGIGDRAYLIEGTEPTDPRSLRPSGDVPITYLSVMAVSGQDLVTFSVDVLISPTGPTAGQTRDQLVALVRGVEF